MTKIAEQYRVQFVMSPNAEDADFERLSREKERWGGELGRMIAKDFDYVKGFTPGSDNEINSLSVVVLTPAEYRRLKEFEWIYEDLSK